jgi:rRNA maturation protein Nop10
MKVHTEIVNGVCPECDEYTMLTCGTDLEQHVNGKITYIPHITKNTLKSKVEEYFDGEA